MDPTDVKRRVRAVLEAMERRTRRARRIPGPIKVGVAVGVAGFVIGCGSDSDDPEPADTAADTGQVDVGELPPPADLYGIINDTVDAVDTVDTIGELPPPVDLYGIMMDATDSVDPMDAEDIGELPPPVDLYGIMPEDAG